MTGAGAGSVRVDAAIAIDVALESLAVLLSTLPVHRTALEEATTTLSKIAVEAELSAASLLDPVGATAVAAATARTLGAIAQAAQCSLRIEAGLRLAAAGYRAADRLEPRLAPLVRAAAKLPSATARAGIVLGADVARGRIPDQLAAASALLEADPELLAALLDVAASGGSPGAAAADLADPDLGSASPAVIAGLASLGYRDRGPATIRTPGPTVDAEGPPRTVSDLIGALRCRNDATDGGGIDVRSIWRTAADGTRTRAVIVNITGTRDWNLTRLDNPNVADFGTNLAALAGRTTAYERGVLAALADAEVQPGEPVMLVGHSQGGLVAAQLVRHLAAEGRLGPTAADAVNVTHLLTAGAPIGLVDLPAQIAVMSLENRGDPVPQLDTADNRRGPHRLTVHVDRGGTAPIQRHSIEDGYLPAAADVDGHDDPLIHGWLASAQDFLAGDEVHTQPYQVSRR